MKTREDSYKQLKDYLFQVGKGKSVEEPEIILMPDNDEFEDISIPTKRLLYYAICNMVDTLENSIRIYAEKPPEMINSIKENRELRTKLNLSLGQLRIQSNNMIVRSTCPYCGVSHKEADIPLWAFEGEGYNPICGQCFKKYFPDDYKEVTAINEEFFIKSSQ